MATEPEDGDDGDDDTRFPPVDDVAELDPAERRCGISLGRRTEETG